MSPSHSHNWLLVAPLMALCVLIWLVPFAYQVFISFTHYDLTDPQTIGQFNGIANYIDSLTKDPYFVSSVLTTFKFTALCLLFETILGFLAALLLFEVREDFGQTIIAFIVVPFAVAPSVVGLIWYFQFNPDFGPFTYGLRELSLLDEALLGQKYAFFSVSLVDIWQNTPFIILIIYSALKAIPKSILEAVALDQISYHLKLRTIYLGYIWHIFVVAVLLRILGLIKTFDTLYILTRGGPGTITETFSLYSNRLNYQELNFGMGAAQGVLVNYFLVFLFACIFSKLRRK